MLKKTLILLLLITVTFSVCINYFIAVGDTVTVKNIYDADVLPNGNIAVLYISESKLYFGIYDPTLNSWSKQEIASAKDASFALDTNGNPHIAFINLNDDLGYMRYNGSSWSSIETIDSINFNDVLGVLTYPDIAVDSSGKVHITYFDSKAGYTGGNDYSPYEVDDLMYATNESGVLTKTVRSFSHGWFYSPNGWRNLVIAPSKIAYANGKYTIGVKQYNYDKDMTTQYHTYNYNLLCPPATPSQDTSFEIRSATTNNDLGFRLYEVATNGTSIYSLFKKSGNFYVTNGTDEISQATVTFVGDRADLYTKAGMGIYYASIATNNTALLYQDGNVKTGLTLSNAISTTHSRISTVVTGGKQYVIYTAADGNMFICNNSTVSGVNDITAYKVPDKLPVTISGVSVTNKAYDGNSISYTGIPTAVIIDTGASVTITDYIYSWYDVTNSVTLLEAPKKVGSYKLTISVASDNTTYIGSTEIPFSISQKNITITGVSAVSRVYDGTNVVSIINGTLVGNVNGDVVTAIVPTTGNISDVNVGNNKDVSLGLITLSGVDSSNYTLTQPTGIKVNILKADISINNVTISDKIYDGTTNATVTNFSFIGMQNSEILALNVNFNTTANFNNANATSTKNVSGTVTMLNTTKSNNYNLLYNLWTSNANITKASGLIATDPSNFKMIKSQVIDYTFDLDSILLNKLDVGTTTYDVSTLTGSDLFSVNPYIHSDGKTLKFTSANIASGTASQIITITTENYINANVTLNFELVDKKPVTISGVSVINKTYDGNAISYTGSPTSIITETGASVAITDYIYSWYDVTNSVTLLEAPKKVGSYKLTINVASDNTTYIGSIEVPFSISQKNITITGVSAVSRVYDGTNVVSIINGTLVGNVNGDVVTAIVPTTGNILDVNVGNNKDVSLGLITLSGVDSSNYTLTQPTGIKVNILKADISINNVIISDKIYDGTTNATVTNFSFIGMKNSETLALNVNFNTTANFNNANAASTKNVSGTVIMLNTTKSNNYNLLHNLWTSNANITKAIGLIATNPSNFKMIKSQVIDYTFDLDSILLNKLDVGTTTYDVSTLTGSDLFSVNPYIHSDGKTLKFTSANIASGTASQIITITTENYINANVTLNFELVDKKPVTISGVSVINKTYDGSAISYIGSPTAVITDTVASVTITDYIYSWYDVTNSVTLLEAPKKAGSYKLTISVASDNTTYIGSTEIPFSINKKEITVKPKAYSIYIEDNLPNIEIEISGLISGENFENVVSLSESFTTQIQNSVANILTNTSFAGDYPIVIINNPTVNSDNYTVNIINSTLTINARPPVVLNYNSQDTTSGITLSNIENSLVIPEKTNKNVKEVTISVKVTEIANSPVYEEKLKAAEDSLKEKGYTLLKPFNIKLTKNITNFDGTSSEVEVLNSDIKEMIKVRIPIPENLKGNTNLTIVYINEQGEVEVLNTTRQGDYLEFETNHFSIYSIISLKEDNEILNPNTGFENIIKYQGVAVIICGMIFSCILSIVIIRRRNNNNNKTI